MKRFYKHQDLLEELFQGFGVSEVDDTITSSQMFKLIRNLLCKVTEKVEITEKMKMDILSACPLSKSQLENLFGGDESSKTAIKHILDNMANMNTGQFNFRREEK